MGRERETETETETETEREGIDGRETGGSRSAQLPQRGNTRSSVRPGSDRLQYRPYRAVPRRIGGGGGRTDRQTAGRRAAVSPAGWCHTDVPADPIRAASGPRRGRHRAVDTEPKD